MKSIVVTHFASLSQGIVQNIARIRIRSDKKSIHAFRVLNKQLRAVLLLLQEIEPESRGIGKSYRKLHKLFKEAGKIRDAQIQRGILKEFSPKTDYQDLVQLNAKKENARFSKKLKKFNPEKTFRKISVGVKAIAGPRSNKELTALIMKFSKNKLKEAIALSEKNDLHKARAKLKNAHFSLEIIKKEPGAKALIATIDPIEQKAGRWQDCMIAIKVIKKSSGKKERYVQDVAGNINKEISRLELQIKKDFKRLKRIIG